MPPLAVDPEALSGAGTAVVSAGDGVAAAVGALTSGFGANTGQDAAGDVFGLAYQDSAKSMLKAAATGINASRRVGFLGQVSASNYSKAEVASTMGGGAAVLPTPPQPGNFDAPGAPWTLGPGIPAPALWALVETFVGDLWPNGIPSQMHAAATCWRTFGAALHGVKDALNGPTSVVGAQQMPEGGLIRQALSELGDDMASIGAQCDKLAKGLDDFADEVAHAQQAIRDLLHRLGTPSGLWHEVVEVFKGHGLDEVKKIAKDIKAVLHHLKGEAQAKHQLLQHLPEMLDRAVVSAEAKARKAWTSFLGEDVGNPVATYFDTIANAGEGVLKELVIAPVQQLDQLNPMRFAYDPQGAAAAWEGMGKGLLEMILLGDPATGPVVDALDPQASPNLQKQLVHAEDWRRDRPGLGFGENVGDGLMFLTGLGEVGAAGRAAEAASAAERATDAADAAGVIGRGERAVGEASEVAGATGAMSDVTKTTTGLTNDLEKIGTDLPKTDAPPGGRPSGLLPPRPPEASVGPTTHPAESTPDTRDLPAQPGGRLPGPPAVEHPPTPTAPGSAEPPISSLEPAATGEHSGAAMPGGAREPVPAFSGPEAVTSPPTPAEPLPSPGAQAAPSSRAPITHAPEPAQPPLASVHSPQSAPMSPPQAPIPESYRGAGHPPDPPPPPDSGGPSGGSDGHGGGSGYGSNGDGSSGGHGHGGGTGDAGGSSGRGGGDGHNGGSSCGGDGHSGSTGDGGDGSGRGSGDGRHDPVHSHEQSGEGWHRLPDEPRDPHYGESLSEHWEYSHNPADPGQINSDVAGLMKDPEAPFGRDPQGHAYTQEQYQQRFNKVGPEGQHWYNYASEDGAVSGSKVAFNDLEQYKKFYGEKLDRIGDEDGRYLAVTEDGMPAPWEHRSLHVDSLGKPCHAYAIESLPDGWKIEVSEIEPAVGQPGGAIQVRILDRNGKPLDVEALIERGILRP